MSRCKASEIPRNEAYTNGTRYKAQGDWPKFKAVGGRITLLRATSTLNLLS